MKKNRLFSALAVLTAASVFTGCFNGTDLTKQYEDIQNRNASTATYASNTSDSASISYTSSVTVTSADLEANRKLNEVVVDFTSEFAINEETLSAVSFLGLTNVADGYATEKALTATLVKVTSTEKASSLLQTTAYYSVDLSSYNNDTVAIRVNAATLKDVYDNAVLNGNGNEIAGEDTDGFVTTESVNQNANGDAFAETISSPVKAYAPKITLTIAKAAKINAVTSNIDGIEFTVDPWDLNLKGDVNKDSAAKLNSIYKLQIVTPGENSWTDKAFNFAWDETAGKYAYLVPVSDLLPGTKYRVVKTNDPAMTLKEYDVEAKVTYGSVVTYEEVTGLTGVSNIYDTDTKTIVSTTAYTISADLATPNTPDEVQKGLLASPVTRKALSINGYGARFEIEFDFTALSDGINPVGIVSGADSDFIVTTNATYGYKKVDCEVAVVQGNTAGVTKIVVTTKTPDPKDKKAINYLASDLLVWVGPNVKISSNAKNPAQVYFGTAKDAVKGAASGYVQLN